MKQPFRVTLGIWLERYRFLHPWLLEFSHEHPKGHPHYLNRISHTFARSHAQTTRTVL